MTVPRHTDRADLELLAEHPGVVVVSGWKNLGICTWTGQAVGPAVEPVERAMVRLTSGGTQRMSVVHLIRDGLALPDAAARSGFIKIMKEYSSELACVAIVVGGTGFWASAMRNAIIGLRVFAPRSFDFRLHGTIDEVVGWLPEAHEKQTGVHVLEPTLKRFLSQAARFEPSAAP